MPRQPFLAEARRLLEADDPVFLPLSAEVDTAMGLIHELAEAFETSHQATRFRLLTFGFLE